MRTLILILLLVAVMTTGRGQTSVTAVVVDPLAAGRVALEDGFAAMAEQSFRVSLEKGALSEADVSAARHYLLESLVAQEKFDAMLALLDGWASSGGVAFDVDVYWRATVLHQQSRYSEAAELLQPFSKTWPNSHLGAPALRLLGLASLKSGNVQSAVDAFEAFAEKYPKNSRKRLACSSPSCWMKTRAVLPAKHVIGSERRTCRAGTLTRGRPCWRRLWPIRISPKSCA